MHEVRWEEPKHIGLNGIKSKAKQQFNNNYGNADIVVAVLRRGHHHHHDDHYQVKRKDKTEEDEDKTDNIRIEKMESRNTKAGEVKEIQKKTIHTVNINLGLPQPRPARESTLCNGWEFLRAQIVY